MLQLGGAHSEAAAIAAVEQARRSVAARPSRVNQDGLVVSAPAELARHIQALRESPAAQPYHAEGWQVALVDLNRVCACQPFVASSRAAERVAGIDRSDLASLAAVTLPLTQGEPTPARFDPAQRTWTIVSTSHNLQIVGPAAAVPPTLPGGEILVPPEGTLLGYAVVNAPSFMQVGRYRGRQYLRDGYHRALGLLGRGITVAPAFVRDISAFEELFPNPRNLLPQDSYRGDRPPVLPDLLDDAVSAAVQIPATQKVIVISAVEFPLAG
jgi:hypothetical protein